MCDNRAGGPGHQPRAPERGAQVSLQRLQGDRSETGASALYVLYVIIAVLVIILLLRLLGVA